MPPFSELLPFVVALAAAGALAGLLAGMFGIGGGAVLVPIFFHVFGILGVPEEVRMQLSLGTSLAIIVPTSIRSFMAHRKRGAVDTALLKGWIIAVPLGTLAAAYVAARASSAELRAIFAIIALALAFRMIFNRASWRLGTDLPGRPARFAVGTGIGILSGLMGIGGGVLNNTFMTLYGRPIHQAVATSSGVGVLISLPGLAGYVWGGLGVYGLPPFSTGYINWLAVALLIPITLSLAPLGAQLAHAMSKRQLEIGFGIFLILVSLQFFATIIV
ncbi:sulfite exporter TauE/SafE family protein [Pseudorhizobium endolithicum]|uniref:Probable membrane transporter protein n=1 Tax=Pseudorhizobium endolithicum TaxID=1191678 RepID=A0ABN7JSF3_9HYPH|nr:sulfite exporter TauE/SafE family protein [Pseudorhizobium endolithicum]CAD6413942.1 sulfite exporter TauE/SafE family protein [Rhizobium sp. Q54]CAD7045737.1 sulfite exporter TauE/SafE family protein [Pseudorhizobium endolithicum]